MFENFHQTGLEIQGNALLRYSGEDDFIVVPSGVERIEAGAFAGVVDTLILPESIREIAPGALQKDCGLIILQLPMRLLQTAVPELKQLSDGELSARLQAYPLPSILRVVQPIEMDGKTVENVEELHLEPLRDSTPRHCIELLNIQLQRWENRAKKYAVLGNHITLPQGATRIEDNAFNDNVYLSSITIPEGVEEIGESAFYGCKHLRSVKLPQSLRRIGAHAFGACKSLTHIQLPDSLQELGSCAFRKSGLQSIRLPGGIATIPDRAFEDCRKLTDVSFPASLRKIEYRAFSGCEKLAKIDPPESLESIGGQAFIACYELVLPEHVRAKMSSYDLFYLREDRWAHRLFHSSASAGKS